MSIDTKQPKETAMATKTKPIPVADAIASFLTIGTGRDVEAHIAQRAALTEGRTVVELDTIAQALVEIDRDGDAPTRAHAGWLLTRLAQTDHAAAAAASKAAEPIPATPFLDAMTRRTSEMTSTKSKTKSTTNGSGKSRVTSDRLAAALAEHARLGKRGPGRKLTDEELAAYAAKVRAENPESTPRIEAEYAYWVEKLAVTNSARWNRAWDGTLLTDAKVKPEPKVKNVTPIAPKQAEKATKAATQKKAVAAAKKQGAASKPLAKKMAPRKALAKSVPARKATKSVTRKR